LWRKQLQKKLLKIARAIVTVFEKRVTLVKVELKTDALAPIEAVSFS